MSTLKLISDILEIELYSRNEIEFRPRNEFISKILLVTLITGIISLINWLIFITTIVPQNNINTPVGLMFIIIYVASGVLYNYGFYELGKYQGNTIIQNTSLIGMILVPSFYITFFISQIIPLLFLNRICVIFTVINKIIFGIGLLKSKSQFTILYRITGILQILISPFFLLPILSVNIIGSWFAIPSLVCLLAIVYYEYKESVGTNSILLSA